MNRKLLAASGRRQQTKNWTRLFKAWPNHQAADTDFRRPSIRLQLVKENAEAAKKRGSAWPDEDYQAHLETFYRKRGFRDAKRELINLKAS